MSAKKGLLLINIGTPDAKSPEGPSIPEVRNYLRQFLMDPFVIDLPRLPRAILVHGWILRKRPKVTQAAYKKIWTPEGSPLLVHSRAFAKGVEKKLPEFVVVLGMCNGNPSLKNALSLLRARGINQVLVAPLFPQYAEATHAGSMYGVKKALRLLKWSPEVIELPAFYNQDFFSEAYAPVLRSRWETLKPDCLLFSFHGLPERQIKKADRTGGYCLRKADCCDQFENIQCYRAQCFRTVQILQKKLGLSSRQIHISFQSRLGRTRWIGPYTDEVLQELPKEGVKNLLVCSPSFVADCLETLEEIGLRGKELFIQAGGQQFTLAPSLNTDPLWIEGFANWIENFQTPRPSPPTAP